MLSVRTDKNLSCCILDKMEAGVRLLMFARKEDVIEVELSSCAKRLPLPLFDETVSVLVMGVVNNQLFWFENHAMSLRQPLPSSQQYSLSSSNSCSLAALFPSLTCLKRRMKSWNDVCRDAWQSSKHQSNVLTACVLFIESH